MPASPHPSSRAGTAALPRHLDEIQDQPRETNKHLSSGQKALLSVALALSHEAELLHALDEPTAALDIRPASHAS